MIVVSAAEMQAMDRKTIEEYGIPGRVLMENAGRGAARTFLQRIYQECNGRVGIVAGRGNNGGDGFVIARYLAAQGVPVTVFLLAPKDRVQGDAADNLKLLPEMNIPLHELPDLQSFQTSHPALLHMDCWIDAILGTGLKSEVKGFFKQVIDFINAANRPVMAVDIPSGLNADNGQICGVCIRATATATFAFPKIGHLAYPGADLCGTIDVIDIGIPPFIAGSIKARQRLITPAKINDLLGSRPPDIHKGRTGHILIVAGSAGKTGAAWMTATASLRAGAGLVTLGLPSSLMAIPSSQPSETMTIPLPDQGKGYCTSDMAQTILTAAADKTCLALGPGLGTQPATNELVWIIIKEVKIPTVVDADGLNLIATDIKRIKQSKAPLILTPHPGEMARLTGKPVAEIQKDRIGSARQLSMDLGVYIVLKGARTIVASPDGMTWINPSGNPGMAGPGMGDILTGLIAGFLSQGLPAAEAAKCGVYLHGLAADLLAEQVPWGYIASEVAEAVPHAIQRVLNNPPRLPIHFPIL